MRPRPLLVAGLLVVIVSGGCGDDVGGGPIDAGIDAHIDSWVFPARPNRALDVVFVVDNSGSMAGEQASLAASFPVFKAALQTIGGRLPDVHLGILSSNVGAAGQAGVPGCTGQGDDGNLLVKAGCAGLQGAYIADVEDGPGNRLRNYTGDLDPLFGCMAQLGTGGCGFEMHLEALYRALQPGKNLGFVRPDANLAVVILADEDDCSTEVGAMFGDPTADVTSTLGPRTSFRCFEFGVTCASDPNPRAFGTKTGCQPTTGSQYMYEVDRYVQFLKNTKPDPSLVIVAGIVGVDDAQHTVVVGPDPFTPTNPVVQKSCFVVDPDDPADGAVPAIRLGAFLRQFTGRNAIATICNASLADALRNIAGLIKTAIGDPCLKRPLRDGDPATTCDRATGVGCEYECSVVDVVDPDGDDPVETVIPACNRNGDTPPCWRIAPTALECPDAPDNLAIQIHRGGASAPLGTVVQVQCVAD